MPFVSSPKYPTGENILHSRLGLASRTQKILQEEIKNAKGLLKLALLEKDVVLAEKATTSARLKTAVQSRSSVAGSLQLAHDQISKLKSEMQAARVALDAVSSASNLEEWKVPPSVPTRISRLFNALQAKVHLFEEERNVARAEASKLILERDELVEEIRSLKAMQESDMETNKKLNDNLAATQKEVEVLKKKLVEEQQEVAAEAKKSADVISGLTAERDSLLHDVESAKRINREQLVTSEKAAEEERGYLKARVSLLERERDAFVARLERLQRELNNIGLKSDSSNPSETGAAKPRLVVPISDKAPLMATYQVERYQEAEHHGTSRLNTLPYEVAEDAASESRSRLTETLPKAVEVKSKRVDKAKKKDGPAAAIKKRRRQASQAMEAVVSEMVLRPRRVVSYNYGSGLGKQKAVSENGGKVENEKSGRRNVVVALDFDEADDRQIAMKTRSRRQRKGSKSIEDGRVEKAVGGKPKKRRSRK